MIFRRSSFLKTAQPSPTFTITKFATAGTKRICIPANCSCKYARPSSTTSFVENDNDVLGDARHEAVDGALRNQCAGGIVWVGDENEPGFLSDCLQHRLQVLFIIRTRHLDHADAK